MPDIFIIANMNYGDFGLTNGMQYIRQKIGMRRFNMNVPGWDYLFDLLDQNPPKRIFLRFENIAIHNMAALSCIRF